MSWLKALRRTWGQEAQPDRAVIDIGSNTVRLVIYSGSARAPEVWLNERVVARLGRDLAVSGAMPDKAMDYSLGALARYAAIVEDLGIADVQTVATAAVREASNGAEFLERVREIGLAPRLLSGEEEARGSASGVIAAFPRARHGGRPRRRKPGAGENRERGLPRRDQPAAGDAAAARAARAGRGRVQQGG
jgi:exopolyphosphatase/guanosine-5'-triphosphate,3'-diphosphate pyrophosphatase